MTHTDERDRQDPEGHETPQPAQEPAGRRIRKHVRDARELSADVAETTKELTRKQLLGVKEAVRKAGDYTRKSIVRAEKQGGQLTQEIVRAGKGAAAEVAEVSEGVTEAGREILGKSRKVAEAVARSTTRAVGEGVRKTERISGDVTDAARDVIEEPVRAAKSILRLARRTRKEKGAEPPSVKVEVEEG